jgi:outer membrane protein assembly factor BamB
MKLIRLIISLLLGLLAVSCASNTKAPAEGTGSEPSALSLTPVTLPNSAIVIAHRNRVVAYGTDGGQLWSFEIADGDLIAAAPVAASDSTTYVRGTQGVYAIAPDGKLLWQTKQDDRAAAIKGIVPLGDSSVAVTYGGTSLTNYGTDGKPRWTFTLPDGDHLTASPVLAANSFIYLRGEKKLYAVDSQGDLGWQADLAQTTGNKP